MFEVVVALGEGLHLVLQVGFQVFQIIPFKEERAIEKKIKEKKNLLYFQKMST